MRHRVCGARGRAARTLAALCAVAAVLGATPRGSAAQSAATVTGTIASTAPGAVVLATAGGAKTIKLTGTTRILRRTAASLADIQRGDFIGVDAKKGADGSLTAVSISILPPQFKGRTREGQWLMTSGDTMTNAVVTESVSGVSGHTVALTYQGHLWKIAVPPSASIRRFAVATASALKAKLQVTVRGSANPDGSVTATVITIDQSMR